MDELQQRVRSLDPLERRVAELERRLEAELDETRNRLIEAQDEHAARLEELARERDELAGAVEAARRALDEAAATAEVHAHEVGRELDDARARLTAAEAAAAAHERRAEELDRLRAEEHQRTEELLRARDSGEQRAEAAEAAAERHELRAREPERRCAELEEALVATTAADAPAATRHLLFVQAGARYELLERDGAPPARGDEVELDDMRFVVMKLGRSPLARDTRPCAYLQAAA
jgi:chromosome segregation ATPase